MRISSAVKTHQGKVREKNEDNYLLDGLFRDPGMNNTEAHKDSLLIEDDSYHTFAVCDGMGGEHYGEIASFIAVKTIMDYCGPYLNEHFEDCIQTANEQICKEIADRNVNRMGTTLAVLHTRGRNASVCNLGDSRAYLYVHNELLRMSEDHRIESVAGRASALTQHLGIQPDEFILEPHIINNIELQEGMVFLLCSDGLSDMVNEEELQSVIYDGAHAKAPDLAACLVDLALEKGGRDNVTVMVVKIESD